MKKKTPPNDNNNKESDNSPLPPKLHKKKENQVHSCIEFGIYLASNTLMDDKDFRPSFSMSFCNTLTENSDWTYMGLLYIIFISQMTAFTNKYHYTEKTHLLKQLQSTYDQL